MFTNHRYSSINNAPTHNAIKVNVAMKMPYESYGINERGFSLISRIRAKILQTRMTFISVFSTSVKAYFNLIDSTSNDTPI